MNPYTYMYGSYRCLSTAPTNPELNQTISEVTMELNYLFLIQFKQLGFTSHIQQLKLKKKKLNSMLYTYISVMCFREGELHSKSQHAQTKV